MSLTKNITIQANDLQGPSGLNEIYIVLSFDQDAIKTAQTPFSDAAWKVAPFYLNKPGFQHMEATYVANLGVYKVMDDGQEIDTAISVGQQIDLINNEDPQFSNLTKYFNPQGFAVNNYISDQTVTIGAGIYGSNGKLEGNPVSVWQNVGYGASVDVQFTPVMSIFAFVPDRNVQSQFQSLTGGINSLLWTHNFADVNLPSSFVLNLAWNASLSEFVLSLVN